MKALIIGDNWIRASVLQKELEEALGRVNMRVEAHLLEVGFPLKIEFPDPESKLTIYDIMKYPEEALDLVGDAEILEVHLAAADSRLIEAGKKLRVIGCPRGGPVNVDVQSATQRGIPVLNAPGRNDDSVADLTMGLLLAEARNIARAHASMMQGNWRFDFYGSDSLGPELTGKVLGIIGFGNIGKKVAKRAKGFDMRIIVHDPFVSKKLAESLGVELVDFDNLLRESDFVCIHARLTKDTRGLIGAEELGKMKPTAYLVNTARGEIIDEVALYNALRRRTIRGAALDVFQEEPLPRYSPFLNLDNVTLTPHIGATAMDVPTKSARIIADQIAAYLSGKKPKNVVNPSVLT